MQLTLAERETRDLLSQIARDEAVRSQVSEEREEHYLRTIEAINMADIKIERENLESEKIELEKRHTQLCAVEAELSRERSKVEEKKKRRKLGVPGGSPGKQ